MFVMWKSACANKGICSKSVASFDIMFYGKKTGKIFGTSDKHTKLTNVKKTSGNHFIDTQGTGLGVTREDLKSWNSNGQNCKNTIGRVSKTI